jgi:hypothetical protein
MLVLIIVGLWTAGLAQAGEMTAEEWQQAYDQAVHIMGTYADSVAAGEAPPIKCGNPLIQTLVLNLSPDRLMPAGPFDRRDTMSFTYGTTHFLLHYTNQGADSIYQYTKQDSLPGTPDYIFDAGKTLEHCWRHLVDTLGFRAPLSDGYYNGGIGGGGDGRLDIYFVNLGFYGATVPESLQATLPLTATSYILLENDYQGFHGYETNRAAALHVSAAHEYFHTIQFNLDLAEAEGVGAAQSTAWPEMSATFMEEEFYDEVNDYFGYLPYYYFFTQWSLRTGYYNPSTHIQDWQNWHMYGSVVFPLFLKANFGTQMIKRIWDGCAAVPGPNWWLATDASIRAVSADSLNLRIMFPRYAIWNLFTGSWARGANYFPDASHYPSLTSALPGYPSVKRIIQEVTSYPAYITVPDSLRPDNLGADYILLRNTAAYPNGLQVTFDGDRTEPWEIRVVELPVDPSNLGQAIYIDPVTYDSTTTTISIPNAAQFDKIVIIPTIVYGNTLRVSYSLVVAPLGEGLLQPNGGERLYPGSVYKILWNLPLSVTEVRIELSLNDGDTWNLITVTSNTGLGYDWTVPSSPSDSCLIRVSDASDGDPADTSGAVFSIVSVGENRIIDPYPNPVWVQKDLALTFRGELKASQAASIAEMTISIMTLAGEKIKTLNKSSSSGAVEIVWDLTNSSGETVAAGPYLAVIEFAGQTEVKKFVVLR